MNQSRWRSKTAWLAMISLILFVLKTYFGYEIPEVDKLIDLLLVVAAGFGVWNNPKDGEKF